MLSLQNGTSEILPYFLAQFLGSIVLVDYLSRQQKMHGRYNPVDPKQAVIMAGLPESFLSKIGNLLIIGAIGTIASIVLAIIYRKTFFRSK